MSSRLASSNPGLCSVAREKSGRCRWTRARIQHSSLSLGTGNTPSPYHTLVILSAKTNPYASWDMQSIGVSVSGESLALVINFRQQNSVTQLVVTDLVSTCKQIHFMCLRNNSDYCSTWTVSSSCGLNHIFDGSWNSPPSSWRSNDLSKRQSTQHFIPEDLYLSDCAARTRDQLSYLTFFVGEGGGFSPPLHKWWRRISS